MDRPYGPLLNFLHHGIGATHVCHHVNPSIPHYNAWRGTALLRQRFPLLVRYDPTPIPQALCRIASRCAVVYQARESLDKGSLSGSSELERVPLAVNCL
jgi:omega-6 fatty acid desaturase (delta-12 desaturase)